MKKELEDLYEQLKKKGLTSAQQRVIEHELRLVVEDNNSSLGSCPHSKRINDYNDLQHLQDMVQMNLAMSTTHSIDDLIARDTQREKDGFPRKIRIGKMIKPSQDGDDKVVIVPTTVEEKLLHCMVLESSASLLENSRTND